MPNYVLTQQANLHQPYSFELWKFWSHRYMFHDSLFSAGVVSRKGSSTFTELNAFLFAMTTTHIYWSL